MSTAIRPVPLTTLLMEVEVVRGLYEPFFQASHLQFKPRELGEDDFAAVTPVRSPCDWPQFEAQPQANACDDQALDSKERRKRYMKLYNRRPEVKQRRNSAIAKLKRKETDKRHRENVRANRVQDLHAFIQAKGIMAGFPVDKILADSVPADAVQMSGMSQLVLPDQQSRLLFKMWDSRFLFLFLLCTQRLHADPNFQSESMLQARMSAKSVDS